MCNVENQILSILFSSEENPLTLLVRMFHKSSDGRLILSVVGDELEQGYDVLTQRYLTDYVRMVHKCHSTTVHLEYQVNYQKCIEPFIILSFH